MAAPIAMAPSTDPTMIQAFFFLDIFPCVAVPAVFWIAAFNGNVILDLARVKPRGATVAALRSDTGETFAVSAQQGIEAEVTRQIHARICRTLLIRFLPSRWFNFPVDFACMGRRKGKERAITPGVADAERKQMTNLELAGRVVE